MGSVINIPKDFKYTKVEVTIFPADDCKQTENEKFLPETFYGISSIIAATALCHNLNLVTHNVKDFVGINLAVSDPF